MISVNYWSVLVSAVVSMIIGSIWYGPLFGKMFIKASGMDQWSPEKQAAEKAKMMWSYVGQFIASLVMFYVLAWVVGSLNMVSVMGGLKTALLVWVGFVVPLALGNALWGGKMTMFWLSIGNMLLTLLAAGVVIGVMH